jgi:hypothetical protein
MHQAPYGFRIVGSCSETRRLVDATAALSGYAECVEQAELTNEGYLSAFQFGDEFRRHLEMTGSTKGYKGPCWSPWLWWDIDRKDDIEAAARAARRLASFLVDRYRIDGDELLVFYSGSKGFHVGLPSSLWRPESAVTFNRQSRQFAEQAAERAGIEIDVGVYDKVRAFRAPNSRHPKTGRHKRRLSFDELLHLKVPAILDLATAPEPFDIPEPPSSNDEAVADWIEAAKCVERKATAHRERRTKSNGVATLNRVTLGFICDGATKGDRHRLLYSAAANLAEFGCPAALAHGLLTESALDSGLTPQEVRRQIECGLQSEHDTTRTENEVKP